MTYVLESHVNLNEVEEGNKQSPQRQHSQPRNHELPLTCAFTLMMTRVATPSMVKTSNAFTTQSNLGNIVVMTLTLTGVASQLSAMISKKITSKTREMIEIAAKIFFEKGDANNFAQENLNHIKNS